jgi:putative transcriptional regulator
MVVKHSLKGYFLVAAPSLVTPFFTRTVILMLEHNEQGAMGLVLNRPTEATVAQVAEQVFEDELPWDKAIHLGGPVPGPLQVVHTLEHLADQTILDGVYSSLEPSKVEAILRAREEPAIVLANYSGWGPGQLESEMAEDSWLICPANEELVFTDDVSGMWELVVRQIRTRQLSDMFGVATVPEDPSVN